MSTGATGYHVKRSWATGGPYALVGSPTVLNFVDTGLVNGSMYFYVVTALNAGGESTNSAEASVTPVGSTVAPDITVTIDPTQTQPISPWIYGINSYSASANASPATLDRAGGNRWTAYNWENNASNAGSDYNYSSDDYLSASTMPAEAVRSIIAADQAAGLASILDPDVLGWLLERNFSPALLIEFTEIRLAIEPGAAALAARVAGPAEKTAIHAAVARMAAADRGDDDPLAADIAFHVAVLLGSRNRFYAQLTGFTSTALRISIRTTNHYTGVQCASIPGHRKIADAIFAGRPVAAGDAMRKLIQEAMDLLIKRESANASR